MAAESMTPKERYRTVQAGGKPDKLPLALGNYNSFIVYRYDVTVEQYCNEPALTADLCCRLFEEFAIDQAIPGASYIFYGMGPETGVRWQWVGNNFPAAVEGPIKNKKDLERYKIPSRPEGYFKNYLEINRLVKQRLGDRMFLANMVLSPFTCACYLRGGVEHVLLDSMTDMEFYDACMSKSVEMSRFLGAHMLALGLDGYGINDVFISPMLVKPDFYWDHIAPYSRQVMDHFAARGHLVPDMFAAFIGKKGDPASQFDGRQLFNYAYGTGESMESIKIGLKRVLPGRPVQCSLSGRMLATWPTNEILAFLKEALDYMVRDMGRYPAIILISVQPPSREDVPAYVEKLRAIVEFRDNYGI